MLRQILIAVDGSSGGSAAARLGADVAARYGASVVVVHVSNPLRCSASADRHRWMPSTT